VGGVTRPEVLVDLRDLILGQASSVGFVHVRVAALTETPWMDRFDAWLARGSHGRLQWLSDRRDERADPRLRLADAKSVVVLGLEHHHKRPADPGGLTGLVARYAWGRDYHNLVGKRLRKLQRSLRGHGIQNWGGVDTAPILERSWAAAAGLGFGGKNCVQIWPARGSWMFLAVLFVDVVLAPDTPLGDHCGTCQRCLDVCPTGAFRGPRDLHAPLCISYWTIEDRGTIPVELRAKFGRWVFGCDLCQEVCPHNADPPQPDEQDLLPRNAYLDLPGILEACDEDLLQRFRGTPLRRPGPDGLRRNAAVVLGNLGLPEAVPVLERAVDTCSALVAEHARWALEQIS
jgi:epoxyqueuosine reductase